MKIPVFYRCLNCKEVYEIIGGEVKCPECQSVESEKLEGEDKYKCWLRSRELLILQKFNECSKFKRCLNELMEWFNENILLVPEEKRPIRLLYKLTDMVTDNKGTGHSWSWKHYKSADDKINGGE